jgi:hypothetical protein
MAQDTPERAGRKLGGYPAIKQAQILGTLSPGEQEEVERLERRRKLSSASERRLAELWTRAFALHNERMLVRKQELARRRERIAELERQIAASS